MQRALAVPEAGGMQALAAEARESPTGVPIEGKAGPVYLAMKTSSPVLPLAVTDAKYAWQKIKRGRRVHLTLAAGEPFRLPALPVEPEREAALRKATERIMREIARLLYDHSSHEPMRRVLRWAIDKIGWGFLAKIKAVEGLENFPLTGPAIIIINHIAFIDPIVVLGNVPRNIVPLAKVEVYKIPGWGIFPRLWDVIPVRREELDRRALERAIAVLRAGEIILVAPEGTRHSAIRDAKEGMAYLALKTGAPILPVAITGTPGFPRPRFLWGKREGVVVKIGKMFRFKPVQGRPPREYLRKMTDEAMYVVAAMLPEELRGEYVDLGKATRETIEE